MKHKKICIVGAGLFGCTIALVLSKAGYFVDLYEKNPDIMSETSLKNQQRFHLGYHYPRSSKTISEIKSSFNIFTKFYGKRIFGKTKNVYAISKENSKINFNEYISILKKNKLKYLRNHNTKIFSKLIENSIVVPEKNLNFFMIKKIILNKITKEKKINLFLNSAFGKKNKSMYKKIIICCYSRNNEILKSIGINSKKIFSKKYELVEKIIVKLPNIFKNLSLVILDGNFLNFDPFIGTKYHLLSAVKQSKLEILNSKYPNFKNRKRRFLKKKFSTNLRESKFKEFIKFSKNYVPLIKESQYIKSFYTIRCVQNSKNDHERRNEINFINKKIITVQSGKWNTCVSLALKIKNILKYK
tara:strand:- start:2389 stop:3459 length:1071 start_codon:yes stop_codon:yes gene_type:complete